jgi:hypothetical protein
MNMRLILGYVLLVVCLLALAAAVFLEVNNLHDTWRMQVFTGPVILTPALWLLLAAVAGVALWMTLTHLLPLSVRMIGRGRRTRRERLLTQALHEARQGQAVSASNPTDETEKR